MRSFSLQINFGAKNDPTGRYLADAVRHLESYNGVIDERSAISDYADPEKKGSISMKEMFENLSKIIEQYNVAVNKVLFGNFEITFVTTKKALHGDRESLLEVRKIIINAIDVFRANIRTVIDDCEIGTLKGTCNFELSVNRKL